MPYVKMSDLERFALDHVRAWIDQRAGVLRRAGRQLQAVIVYGPMIEHRSTDELVVMEIVSPLDQTTTADITAELSLDARNFGRVALVSISWEHFKAAIKARVPSVIHLLQAHKVLDDRARLGVRSYLAHA